MRIRTRRLPAGYNELEYIESTGTQWINTGLAVNYNYKVALTMYQENNVEAWQQFFGIRGYGAQIGLYAKRIDDNVVCYDYVNRSSYIPRDRVFPLKKIHNVLVDKNKVYVDGSLIFQVAEQSFGYTTNSLFLFAYNSQDGSRDGYCGRLYNCSMWDNGTLARKFIPAERISDNKPGLYDLVNSVFYTNIGTGDFIKGPYASCSYQASLTLLPSEYQEVEYIQSSGTQYIDTGFVPNISSRIAYKIKTSSEQTGDSSPIIGTRVGGGNTNRFFPFAYSSAAYSTKTGRITLGDREHVFSIDPNSYYIGVFDAKNLIATLNSTTYPLNANNFSKTQDNTLCIFGTNGYGTNHYLAKGSCYYCKMWDNDILVKDLVPCYRKSDSVIGMYDVVNQQFYTNSGTGTFLKGNNVVNSRGCAPRLSALPTTYQGVEYIQGSGTQFIKTTYVPTSSTTLDMQFMVTSTQTSGGGWEQITGEKTAYHSTSSLQVAFCTLSGTTNNHLGLDYGQANDLAATTLPGIDRNVAINVKMTPNNWIVNNTHIIPHNYSLSGTGIPLWIFDCNKANTNERPFIGRIYFYKIYENKNLIHNFLPCYRKSDDVIGLYDTVGKQFYTNQGTGTFTKGADKNHIW